MAIVYIRVGHGGTDAGAVNGNRQEADDNLRMSLAVAANLQSAGHTVYLSRRERGTVKPDIGAIRRDAENKKADWLIDIHRNASTSTSANGAYCLIRSNSPPRSRDLALAITKRISDVGASTRSPVIQDTNTSVLQTNIPGTIVELLFISNNADNQLYDSKFNEFAQAIAQGVVDVIGGKALGTIQVSLPVEPGSSTTETTQIVPTVQDYTMFRNTFMAEALKHVGEDSKPVQKATGLKPNQPWAAVFIMLIATATKVIGKCIPDTIGIGDIARLGVQSGYGEFILGPWHKKKVMPELGDLLFIRHSQTKKYNDIYESDGVGIVVEVQLDKVRMVIADNDSNDHAKSKVVLTYYPSDRAKINGYYRPKWSNAGDATLSPFAPGGLLYTTKNGPEDAIIREVAYIKDFSEAIASPPTDVKLSIINYTSALAQIFGSNIGLPVIQPTSTETAGTDKLPQNARIVVDYFISKGLNPAQAVGFAANIKAESEFNPGAVNPFSGASGLVQWLGSRKNSMLAFVGSDWRTDVTGQLDFAWSELHGPEKATMQALTPIPNTRQGASDAAYIILTKYERAGNYGVFGPQRRKNAEDLWDKLVIFNAQPLADSQKKTENKKL